VGLSLRQPVLAWRYGEPLSNSFKTIDVPMRVAAPGSLANSRFRQPKTTFVK
jgi:hypothetical protein